MSRFPISGWDRFMLSVAPRWTMNRIRARIAAQMFVRHYEAADPGRRTQGWSRNTGDANRANAVAISELRMHARELVRNNGWARKARRVIANSTVGWGIVPEAGDEGANALWKEWAESPRECDSEGRLTFYGIQHLVMKSLCESGEVLIRRRIRRPEDDLVLPLQIQVLESDYLDTGKDGMLGEAGGPVINGVEFDKLGKRAAYWIFPEHPGSMRVRSGVISKRVPASDIIHVFDLERPGQVRGVSWFGAGIVPLKDFDEYEDASLLRQKIAACFAAFVTDDGMGGTLGEQDENDDLVEVLEPGLVAKLPPGKQVTFGNPPAVTQDSFNERTLRKVAAALGVTYEDLTGDYSKVNFSSARMARLAFQDNLKDWRWNMLVPLLCDGVWAWVMDAALLSGALKAVPQNVTWNAPALPMIEPDKEGLAIMRQIRAGMMTLSQALREQGLDPTKHLAEYAKDLAELDRLGIKIDSDVRAVSQAGLTQERQGAGGGGGGQAAGGEQTADRTPAADSVLEAELVTELLAAVRATLRPGR
jgi:lambda family phage portal protein